MNERSVMTTARPNETLPASCTYRGLLDDVAIVEVALKPMVVQTEELTTGYESTDPATV